MSKEIAKVDAVKIELSRPITDEGSVRALLGQYRKAFEVAAVKHLDVDRLLRVALMTVSRSSSLLECTAASLLGSIMLSAQLGLDLAAREAYLVPFKNKYGKRECQLIPDYRGIMKLVRQSGMVSNFRARCVYKQDKLEIEEGLNPRLVHIQAYDHDFKDEDLVGVYTVADFCGPDGIPTGIKDFQFMPIGAIKRIKNRSKAGSDGPWVTDFAEMAMKTGIKHHAKTLPQNIQLATALQLDDRAAMERPQKIQVFEENGLTTIGVDPVEDRDEAQQQGRADGREAGKVDLKTLKPSEQENRGHDDTKLGQVVGGTSQAEPKPGRTEPKQESGIEPDATLTDAQKLTLENLRTHYDIPPGRWLDWAKTTFKIKAVSKLTQRDYPAALAWHENAGKESA